MDFLKTQSLIRNKKRSKTLRNRPILHFKLKKVQRYHPTKKCPKIGHFCVFLKNLKIFVFLTD